MDITLLLWKRQEGPSSPYVNRDLVAFTTEDTVTTVDADSASRTLNVEVFSMSVLSQSQSHTPTKKRRVGRTLVATTVAAALFVVGVIVAVPAPVDLANGEDARLALDSDGILQQRGETRSMEEPAQTAPPLTASVVTVTGKTSASVVITGTATTGSTLTASVTNVVPSSGATITYQWYRDGWTITGATSQTYTITQADAGSSFQVLVIVMSFGWESSLNLSESVAVTGQIAAVVSLSGTPMPGYALTAWASNVVPSWGAVLSYQWMRNGVAIPGEIYQRYFVMDTDVGSVIEAQVTVSVAGCTPLVKTTGGMTVKGGTTYASVYIKGTATPGAALTIGVISLLPSYATMTYQWLRDGQTIPGATNSSYTVAKTDIGTNISARVTVAAPGWTGSWTMASGLLVKDKTSVSVEIIGTGAEGSTLTASVNNVVPSSGATLAYQWLRDGEVIAGATNPTYTPVASDSTRNIQVRVTVSAAGWVESIATSWGVFVPGDTSVSVNIYGTAKVGSSLSAVVSNAVPSYGGQLAFQWFRDGQVVSGATGSTYFITEADISLEIQVRATLTCPGWTPSSATDSIGTVSGTTIALVWITGVAAPGSTLTASLTDVLPSTGAMFTYQWFRDGQEVLGAMNQSYVVSETERGASITVQVSVAATGWSPNTYVSLPVVVASTATASVSITGTVAQGSTLTATVTNLTPANATVFYQWLRNGTAISGATAKTYVLTASDIADIQVRVRITASGWLESTTTSAAVKLYGTSKVAASIIAPNQVLEAGVVLKASATSVSPTNATVSYQWLRAGVAITGAVQSTYTLVRRDAGESIQVRVTASAPGWTPYSAVSASVTPPRIKVTISGTVDWKQTLTANESYLGLDGALMSFQWYRDGVPIPGARGKTYVLDLADSGKEILVKVHGVGTGGWDVTVASPPIPPSQTCIILFTWLRAAGYLK